MQNGISVTSLCRYLTHTKCLQFQVLYVAWYLCCMTYLVWFSILASLKAVSCLIFNLMKIDVAFWQTKGVLSVSYLLANEQLFPWKPALQTAAELVELLFLKAVLWKCCSFYKVLEGSYKIFNIMTIFNEVSGQLLATVFSLIMYFINMGI